jgi:hypothetical protein
VLEEETININGAYAEYALLDYSIPFDQIVEFFDKFEGNRAKYLKILVQIG